MEVGRDSGSEFIGIAKFSDGVVAAKIGVKGFGVRVGNAASADVDQAVDAGLAGTRYSCSVMPDP